MRWGNMATTGSHTAKRCVALLIRPWLAALGVALCATIVGSAAQSAETARTPNIVFILTDDLGYGEVGCYGQKVIQTPNIDRMATEGLRFTDFYAGSTVCAPARCTLMTGLHTGHCRIRGNLTVPLEPSDVTVASVLKRAGYTTGLMGKWGLGEDGSTGVPQRQGFDDFFGYLNQVHAHNHYPDFLWRNGKKVQLRNEVTPVGQGGGGIATRRVDYSDDLFADAAVDFIDRNAARPFFLYWSMTVPHANNEGKNEGMEVPDYGPYADRPWPAPEKGRAAMITRIDGYVGRLLAKLKSMGLDDNTIVFFTSDNGPHAEGGADPNFFHSSGPLQGIKRSMHDGGIRVPTIARWPGHIQAGGTSATPLAFWDVLPTLAQLAGAKPPAGLDGISFVPTLLGRGDQPQHQFLYWEFHEGDSQQAVRMGPWKAIRVRPGAPLALYDLRSDLGEAHDVAAAHPDVVATIEQYLTTARSDSEPWPLKIRRKAKK